MVWTWNCNFSWPHSLQSDKKWYIRSDSYWGSSVPVTWCSAKLLRVSRHQTVVADCGCFPECFWFVPSGCGSRLLIPSVPVWNKRASYIRECTTWENISINKMLPKWGLNPQPLPFRHDALCFLSSQAKNLLMVFWLHTAKWASKLWCVTN